MTHIKKINEFIAGRVNEEIEDIDVFIVNNQTSGRHKYVATFIRKSFNKEQEYQFIVYANNEDDATDILFDYIKRNHKELIATVPNDFTNDWGYDDDGGYTPYGEDCPYIFNTDCTIAVNADEFYSMDEID